jgi:hypothetical protein
MPISQNTRLARNQGNWLSADSEEEDDDEEDDVCVQSTPPRKRCMM